MKHLFYNTAVALAATMAAGSFASADDLVHPYGGTTQDPSAASSEAAIVAPSGPISPANIFSSAQYGTGGVALRNRGAGGISVSGVVLPVKAAYLYWAVITNGAPPPPVTHVNFARVFPPPAAGPVNVIGAVVGTGASPCWGGTGITVYKASVPLALANGNGSYQVTLFPGASGSTTGGDPWVAPVVFPLFEGASLVIVGTGTATVAIYDKGLSGMTFHGTPGLTYTLRVGGRAYIRFDNIGADGQIGKSVTPTPGLAGENTTLNGVPIAGPASAANTSDWDGNSGSPLPQLWDDTGHDISGVRFNALSVVKILEPGRPLMVDCLTPVANVVSSH